MSLSVPLADAPLVRSFAVAVLTSGLALRPDANATGAVNTSALPAPTSMRAPVVPKLVCPAVPVTAPQLDVPPATHVALAVSVTPAGSGSAMVTLSASDTPVLVTVTV